MRFFYRETHNPVRGKRCDQKGRFLTRTFVKEATSASFVYEFWALVSGPAAFELPALGANPPGFLGGKKKQEGCHGAGPDVIRPDQALPEGRQGSGARRHGSRSWPGWGPDFGS